MLLLGRVILLNVMKLGSFDLRLPRFGFVAPRNILRIAEKPVLHRKSDRKEQNRRRIKGPVTAVPTNPLQHDRQEREECKKCDVSEGGEGRRLVTPDQPAVIDGIMGYRRHHDDQQENKKM